MKKHLALLLALMMLVPALVACNAGGGAETAAPNTNTENNGNESTSGVLDIPTEYDWDGYEVKILVSGNYKNNDFEGEETGDVVSQAQHKRNVEVETQYKVVLAPDDKIKFGSQASGTGTGTDAFSNMYMSESYDYDFATIGSYNAGACAYRGYFTDLNSLPNIDLSKDWWSQSANRQFEIKGRMYFATGDITLAENKVVHLALFNKDLQSEKKIEDPYELVRNNKWTWDVFAEHIKKVSTDVDGNQVMNEKDLYGLLTWSDAYGAAVVSAGSQIATVDENGMLNLTLMNDRTMSIVDKYSQIIFDTNTCFDYQYGYGSSTWDTNRWAMFSEDRALYALQTAVFPSQMREYDVNFGLLPYPKLDEEQDNYYSLTAAYHNQYVAVPFFVENPERTGMLLEILAYKGMKYVTPAFYEKQLVGRDTRDNESEEMLNIIYANVIYDPGLVYRISGMANTYNQVRTQRTNVFVSQYEASKATAEKDISAINELFQADQQ